MEGPLDQRQKKTSRDLSDLKARLGLAKNEGAAAPPPAGAQMPAATPPPAGTSQAQPQGVVAPPGVAQPQQNYAQPDASRDPFAAAGGQIAAGRTEVIVDKGPQIDIPIEKKKPTGLIIGVAIAALVALFIGYAFGGVMQSRKIYNKTVEDAAKIKEGMGKLADTTKKVIEAVASSSGRVKKLAAEGKLDSQLLKDLRGIQAASPLMNLEKAKAIETKIFRTNYALMEDLVISRMFQYFNNSLKLIGSVNAFVDFADRHKKELELYLNKAKAGSQKYGLYLAMDKGQYFIGGLTQITVPMCQDKKPWNNRSCQLGFMVSETGEKWSWRPGKPNKKTRTKLSDIVVPLPPNDKVLQGFTAKPGQVAFGQYVAYYRQVKLYASLLNRDYKSLKEDLGKQAAKTKVFTF